MGVNLQEFLDNKVIGNVRSGTRDEKDRPIALNHFDVHIDKSTSSMAVEIFNQMYTKPTKLKIKFINQNPIDVCLERYEGRKRRCYGNNREAIIIDKNGKKQKISCNVKECPYKQSTECKYRGRLYFLIQGLEDEGIWCYPIGCEKGIEKICARIARANRLNEDLTKDWYELFLKAEDSPVIGKNYIPDIRKIENKISNHDNKKPNYLKLVSFGMTIYNNKKVPKIKFIDLEAQNIELILMPEAKQDILELRPESIILPIKMEKTEKGTLIKDYKIIKAISSERENKKAV